MSMIGKVLTKGAGIAALGLVANDAHYYGKVQADVNAQSRDARAVQKRLNNTMHMNTMSNTTNKMKDFVYKLELQDNVRHFVNSGTGYFKGIFKSLVDNVVPLGLGALALFTTYGRRGASGNPIAKGSAIALAGYGVFKFIKDGIGLGQKNELEQKL